MNKKQLKNISRGRSKINVKSYVISLFFILLLLILVIFFTQTKSTSQSQIQEQNLPSAIITINPKWQNYSPDVIGIDLSNETKDNFMVKKISLTLLKEPKNQVSLYEDKSNLTYDSEDVNLGTFSKNSGKKKIVLDLQNLNKQIGENRFFITSKETLQIESIEISYSNDKNEIDQLSKIRYINDLATRYDNEEIASVSEFILQNNQFETVGDSQNPQIKIGPGTYIFQSNIIIPQNTKLTIHPGTTLKFMPDTYLLSYSSIIAKGTQSKPIIFTSATDKPWGNLTIIKTGSEENLFDFVSVSNASPTQINGIDVTGGLSAHYTKITIKNSFFQNNHGDDGANLKYSIIDVENSKFMDNFADGLDLDVSSGIVKNNQFENNGNDGLDISFNKARITGNISRNNGDKCISVGEISTAPISDNYLEKCQMGIAVKDQSDVVLKNNTIKNCVDAIATYIKKPIYKDPKATLIGNIFQNNKNDISKQNNAQVTIQ